MRHFGKLKGRTETGEAGENAGAQAAEQATTSNAGVQATEQATTSNPSEFEAIEGKFAYEEIRGMMPNRWFEFFGQNFNNWDDEIFHGTTHHYQRVAVKLIRNQGDESEEFEVAISALRQANHPNLLKVLGDCIKGERRFVVYEFSNLLLSLDDHLFDEKREPLDWNARMKIALGCAKGLEYLHKTMDPPVIHRSIRSKNVYVDDEFVPKLFDFGLPKKAPTSWQIIIRDDHFLGWRAPEYLQTDRPNLLSDVYSFGVLLLVIITGREAYDTKEGEYKTIAERARSAWKTKKMNLGRIVDPRIKLRCSIESVSKCFEIAVSCINLNPSIRPDISEVRQELERIASRPDFHTVGGSSKAASSSSAPS